MLLHDYQSMYRHNRTKCISWSLDQHTPSRPRGRKQDSVTFNITFCGLLDNVQLRAAWPIPVAERSKAWVCGRSLSGVAGSNTAGAWMSICCECCVLSGTGLCDGLITRPEESYRLWCVSECNREPSIKRTPWPTAGWCPMKEKFISSNDWIQFSTGL